jgi:hypothetical protein
MSDLCKCCIAAPAAFMISICNSSSYLGHRTGMRKPASMPI